MKKHYFMKVCETETLLPQSNAWNGYSPNVEMERKFGGLVFVVFVWFSGFAEVDLLKLS